MAPPPCSGTVFATAPIPPGRGTRSGLPLRTGRGEEWDCSQVVPATRDSEPAEEGLWRLLWTFPWLFFLLVPPPMDATSLSRPNDDGQSRGPERAMRGETVAIAVPEERPGLGLMRGPAGV